MIRTALIMAGGRGTRFWPRSRKSLPKQFLSLTGDGKTMIELTVERLLPMMNIEDIFISTNSDYKELVKKQLPNLPEENIIVEPIGRNTAPCIGLGAIHIAKKYGDATMIVLPSDHEIYNKKMFLETLDGICKLAESGEYISTIGIKPNYPETGYGYIKYLPDTFDGNVYKVERFVEKPNVEKAKEYLESGEYLWNSGQFAFKASTILNKTKMYLKDNYERLMIIKDAIGKDNYEEVLNKEFEKMESISIDYGILEKDDMIYVKSGEYGWDDVGSWLAIERLQNKDECGNVITGNVISEGLDNSIIQAEGKLIALVGIKDLVVVDTDDATLICHKDKCGDIKKIMDKLSDLKKDEYL